LAASLDPADFTVHLFSSFIQDEFALVPDRLHVTLGAKLEHEYYNGFAFMPSASVVWTPTDHQTLWAAVSRAVQTPSAITASVRYNFGGIHRSRRHSYSRQFFWQSERQERGSARLRGRLSHDDQ
jgi:outer membrane receptor protein involved in Fe transport